MNLKRDNWTNAEVVAIIEGIMIAEPEGGELPPQLVKYNKHIKTVADYFRANFMVPETSLGALAMDADTGIIYHVGDIPKEDK